MKFFNLTLDEMNAKLTADELLKMRSMLNQKPVLNKTNAKLTEDEFSKLFKMAHAYRPWPYLAEVQLDKQIIKTQQPGYESTLLHTDGLTYTEIEFGGRRQLWCDDEPYLSHSIICFTPLGDKTYWFDSPEDDLIDAELRAGNGREIKQAFISAKRADDIPCTFELEDFCMLSITHGDENSERGIFTVFSRKRGLLYVARIEGFPNLCNAKLPPVDEIAAKHTVSEETFPHRRNDAKDKTDRI